jgi:uncharacterized membrane protein
VGDAGRNGGLSKTRIEALTDGIFAIAMTLMVFDIKLPVRTPMTPGSLRYELIGLWPRFLAYPIQLHHAWCLLGGTPQPVSLYPPHRSSVPLDQYFLPDGVSLIPFSTRVLGQYPAERTALVVYGLNLIMVGGFLYAHWWYATHNHRLVGSEIHPEVVRLAKSRILTGPATSILAISVSFVSRRLSLAIFALIPLLYLIPRRIDYHWLVAREKDSEERQNHSPEGSVKARVR